MKINDTNLTGISSSQLGATQQTGGVGRGPAGKPAPAGGGRVDQVHLSDLASQMSRLTEGSPERTNWLERLGAEVQAGRYRVDARELSRRIVDDMLKAGL